MRLRSFTGRTMTEAMSQVRQSLGPDAVIVSTQEDSDGLMRVTAALDTVDTPVRMGTPEAGSIDALALALAAHGLAPELTEKILAAALPYDDEDPLTALSSALAALFTFNPLAPEAARRVILFAGPPGAGKTVTAAKLAARTLLAGGSVRLVSADAARAGAADQLAAFARILGVKLYRVEKPPQLRGVVESAGPTEFVLIDTAGVNPYNADELRELRGLVGASAAEPVMVLPSGGDAVDTMEMARSFRDLGCARIAVTRLDIARRLGSVIAAADALRLDFAEAGVASAIADGLSPFHPTLLARLLLTAAARSRRPLLEKTR
ncbi:MAG TPA: GTPase [Stellaceae bacterium]|nr:GTPase [Stellaceae bacterium]